jgi:hypothetical protein
MPKYPIQVVYLAILLMILTACSTNGATPTPETSKLITPIIESTKQPDLLPTPTQMVESTLLPQYQVKALMNYDAGILDVTQVITFTNRSGVEIPDMILAVQPNRIQGVFKLVELSQDHQKVKNPQLEGQLLKWVPKSPLLPDQSTRIDLVFQLDLPEIQEADPNVSRPQIFGISPSQVNLTDWYPMLVPYQAGEGWWLSDPWYYGEHLVYPLANFDVNLSFTDPSRSPVVAASTLAQPTMGGHRYVLTNGRGITLSISRKYRVLTTETNGVTVLSYFFPGDESAGQAVLDTTARAVKTFSSLFGQYPHKAISAVQGDFKDGMEFDGLYFLSDPLYEQYDGTSNNYLTMIAAHETSHQWWFSRVASDQANHPWLDESLATYCEKIYYEINYPGSVRWWWATRIDFYSPSGTIDGKVASYDGFLPYTNATYRMGARFLEDLRQAVGEEAFFVFLKDYASQLDGKIATQEDFFRILRLHSNADIRAILAKYFSNSPANSGGN